MSGVITYNFITLMRWNLFYIFESYLQKKQEIEHFSLFTVQNVSRLTGIDHDEPIGIPSDKPSRWMAVGVAMTIQENGTTSIDWFAERAYAAQHGRSNEPSSFLMWNCFLGILPVAASHAQKLSCPFSQRVEMWWQFSILTARSWPPLTILTVNI